VEAEEPELEIIHQMFIQLIQQTQQTAATEVVGQASLFEANRMEARKKSTKSTKPFNSRMDKTTFPHYTTVWKPLLSIYGGHEIWRQMRSSSLR